MGVSKMTLQRTISWNVAGKKQLAKVISEYVRDSSFCSLRKVYFEGGEVCKLSTCWYWRQYYDEVKYWASRCLYQVYNK